MANTLGSVEIDLIARVGRLEADMARAQRTVRSKTRSMADSARQNMRAIGAAAAAAGTAFAAFTVRQINAADEIAKTAEQVGISAESLQELRFAAERTGAGAQKLDDGMLRLNRRLGLFVTTGGGPAAASFEQLGISATTAEGKVKSTEQVFNEIVAALEGYGSQAEIAAIASGFFGDRAGPQLASLLNEGSEGIRELREEKRQYGIVTNEAAEKAEQAADALTNVKSVLGGTFTRLVADNAEQIAALASGFADLVVEAGEFWGLVERDNGAIAGLRGEANELASRIMALRDQVRQYEEQLTSADEHMRNVAAATLPGLRAALDQAEAEYAEMSAELRGNTQAVQDNSAAVDANDAEHANLAATLPSVRDMLDLAKTALDNNAAAQEDLAEETADTEQETRNLASTISDHLNGALGALVGQAQQLKSDFESLRNELDPVAAATEEYKADVDTLAQAFEAGLIPSAEEYAELLATLRDRYVETTTETENLTSTQASIEDWASALQAAFGGIEGSAGDAIRGIVGVIGTINEMRSVAAQQGGSLNIAQQLQFGASLGALTGQILGIQGPSGQLGAAVGGAGGMFLGGLVGAGPIGAIIGAALGGSLFEDDGETTPRIQIMGGRALTAADAGTDSRYFRRTDLGVSVRGQRITEALGDGYAQILDQIVSLDAVFAQIARSTDLTSIDRLAAQVSSSSGGDAILGTYEGDVSVDQILADRFNALMRGFDESVQRLVGTVSDTEDGLRRLGASITLIDELDSGALEQYAEAMQRADRTVVEALRDQARELTDLAWSSSGTTSELEQLAAGTQAFNAAIVQTLMAIESASQGVTQITQDTRDAFAFRQAGISGGAGAQRNFLIQRAEQLIGEIGTLGSAAAVQQQIQLINQLIAQAGGLVSDERFAQFVQNVDPMLERAETAAQARLDQFENQASTLAQQTSDAVRDAIGAFDEPAASIATAADTQSAAAETFAAASTEFAGSVVTMGSYLASLPDRIEIVVAGNEVNTAA